VPAISHHYLPQVYLRRFALRETRKLLWEYDKTTGLAKPSTPKKSGCEDHYHSFKTRDGTIDTGSIENQLGRIETAIDPVYEAIRMQRLLTDSEWAAFFAFAGLMMVRVPHFISTFDDFASKVLDASYQMLSQSEAFVKGCEARGVPREMLGQFEVRADRGFSLSMCLESMQTPMRLFSQMGWIFLKAPANENFITGDNPVSHCAPGRPKSIYPPGLADQDIEIALPLSRTACAVGAWKTASQLYEQATAKTVEIVNVRTAMAARRYLYGPKHDPKFFVPRPPDAL